MQWFRRPYVWLGLITLLALIVRFWQLGVIPISLYWDEAAMGYNAYSILHTGRDEYGTVLPILFRSFNDYKMGAYIYLTAASVGVFGLTEFAVRFWSALFGSMTTVVVYFLMARLVLLTDSLKKYAVQASLIAAGLFAISPWSINFSRVGFEANVGVFVVGVATIFFLDFFLKKQQKWYFLSLGFFALAVYFYRSEWVFVPLFVSALHVIGGRDILPEPVEGHTLRFAVLTQGIVRYKDVLYGLLLFIVLLIPLGIAIKSEKTPDRSAQVNFMQEDIDKLNYDMAQNRLKYKMVGGDIWFNRRLLRGYQIGGNYLSNLSPQYLFLSGDPEERHGARGMGLLYMLDAPFLLFGMFALWRHKGLMKWIMFAWVVLGIVPAAVSLPNPHALRTLNNVIPYTLITALGIAQCLQWLTKRKQLQTVFGVLVMLGYAALFTRFLYLYFVFTPRIAASHFADGYKQLYTYVSTRDPYPNAIISGEYWKPYIYFLFYERYDPAVYQKSGSEHRFGRYIFGDTDWDQVDPRQAGLSKLNLAEIAHTSNIMVALSPREYGFQHDRSGVITATHVIYDTSGKAVFYIARPW